VTHFISCCNYVHRCVCVCIYVYVYLSVCVCKNICVCAEFTYVYIYIYVSHDNSVGIALGYGLDDRSPWVRFPAGTGTFSLHRRVQNGSGAHAASYPMSTRGSFPCEQSGRSVEMTTHLYLVPRSENEWSYISSPSIGLRGMVLI
jgi:hypothetical protein